MVTNEDIVDVFVIRVYANFLFRSVVQISVSDTRGHVCFFFAHFQRCRGEDIFIFEFGNFVANDGTCLPELKAGP